MNLCSLGTLVSPEGFVVDTVDTAQPYTSPMLALRYPYVYANTLALQQQKIRVFVTFSPRRDACFVTFSMSLPSKY